MANNQSFPISAAATWNIANGATLDMATPYVTDAASVIINGVGNNATAACGWTPAIKRVQCCSTRPTARSATVTPRPSTISGVISDGGHDYGFTLVGAAATNTLVLRRSNTYTGPTTNTIGMLELTGSIKGDIYRHWGRPPA